MAGLKNVYASKSQQVYKPNKSKQPNSPEEERAANERVKEWLDQSQISPDKRDDMVAEITKLRVQCNIDITVPGPVTSLFITHKAELVPLPTVVALIKLPFTNGKPKGKLLLILSWKFHNKYPSTRLTCSSKLISKDLEDLCKICKTTGFKHAIAGYQPPLERILPDNKEHKKALEMSRPSTAHPYNMGRQQSNVSFRPGTPISSANNIGFGNLPTPAPTPAPTTPRFPSYHQFANEENDLNLHPGIKRERSPDEQQYNTPQDNKRAKPLSNETTALHQHQHQHQNLTNKYMALNSKLAAERITREATIRYERACLEAAERELTVWFEDQSRLLKAEEAKERERQH